MSLSKEYGAPIPFFDHLGIVCVPNTEGRALLELQVKPELCNSWNAAHGGVLASLLDSAMSLAARLSIEGPPGGIATVDLNIKFISPSRGSRLLAEGKVIGGGRSTIFCEAEVRDEHGVLLAKGISTLKAVAKKEPG